MPIELFAMVLSLRVLLDDYIEFDAPLAVCQLAVREDVLIRRAELEADADAVCYVVSLDDIVGGRSIDS
jgi:hypothetical protein